MKRLRRVRAVFLDMDGTIYHGNRLFPTTRPFLDFLESRGVAYTFLSNNSSYGTGEYVDRLAGMGIAARPENFYISTDYAIDYLKRRHPEWRRIFLLGMPGIVPAFEAAGLVIDEERPQAVVVAFDRELTYARLCRAAWHLRHGVPGFATHPDRFCPTDQPTWLPDCGAVSLCLEAATGVKLTVLGKPDPGMLEAAARRLGTTPGESLMVGDRLGTDIALGLNAGALTCHIAAPDSELAPPENVTPDFAVRDLGELEALWRAAL